VTTTLSKTNPPQKGDRLANGWVCVEAPDFVNALNTFSWWKHPDHESSQPIFNELLYDAGVEVERAEEPIVFVTDASRAWGIRALDTTKFEKFCGKPDGTRFVLILESEYKRLRGEGNQ